MSRRPVQVRDATPDDAQALVELWTELSRSGGPERVLGRPSVLEAAAAVAQVGSEAGSRLLVGVLDGEVVGMAFLRWGTVSPLHAESTVCIERLHVRDDRRRHGVGRALLEAAVCWAEETETGHVFVGVPAGARDANRFMARLGLAQVAVLRGASVGALRAALPREGVSREPARRITRHVGQVVAQRRSQRRLQERAGSSDRGL